MMISSFTTCQFYIGRYPLESRMEITFRDSKRRNIEPSTVDNNDTSLDCYIWFSVVLKMISAMLMKEVSVTPPKVCLPIERNSNSTDRFIFKSWNEIILPISIYECGRAMVRKF